MTYWVTLFSLKSWTEFRDAGASVAGFRRLKGSALQKVGVGDRLMAYVSGLQRFVGLLEVASGPYRDDTRIWSEDLFPYRLKVRPLILLTPETGVPINDLRDELSFFKREFEHPAAWGTFVRMSPMRWDPLDGQIVATALHEAESRPVVKPLKSKR